MGSFPETDPTLFTPQSMESLLAEHFQGTICFSAFNTMTFGNFECGKSWDWKAKTRSKQLSGIWIESNESFVTLPLWTKKVAHYVIPVDIKNGILNLPSRTRERKLCKVLPSNGSAPHTSTYNTTPRLWKKQNKTTYDSTNRVCKSYWWVKWVWLLLNKFWSHFGVSGVK